MEKSQIDWIVRKADGRKIAFLDSISAENSIIYEDSEGGRHLWRDDITRETFMSETLVEALRGANVSGFDFLKCTAVKR